jgi:flagellar protein FliS
MSLHTPTSSVAALRQRFAAGAVDTATGPRVVVMAYDRLERDLAGAIEALDGGDLPTAHELLCHAQDLVHELLGMLDLDAWEHAATLAAIYRYVIQLLTTANVAKRAADAATARALLAELGAAFRTAADGSAPSRTAADGSAAPGTATAPTTEHRVWLQA